MVEGISFLRRSSQGRSFNDHTSTEYEVGMRVREKVCVCLRLPTSFFSLTSACFTMGDPNQRGNPSVNRQMNECMYVLMYTETNKHE